jgi:7 transmembrane receptor (rhodopsin family)
MNSPAPSEHIFHDPIFSEVEDEDNGLYYDEEGNVLDLSHVDWSQHAFVAANNDSCVSAGDDLLVPSAGRIVALVFFMVIFMVGVVGNGLVVYTVGRQVSTRKVTYLYLLNLSASNLLYLVICLPTLSVSHTIISWPFGNVLCEDTFHVTFRHFIPSTRPHRYQSEVKRS